MEIEEIIEFVSDELVVDKSKIHEDTDLYELFGVDGDDCFEFEESFAEKYSVNMSGFLWYFHHGEEASLNLGALFFKPPYKRVPRIVITPTILFQSAVKGEWSVKYPDHELPIRRYDIYVNYLVLCIFAVGALIIGVLSA